MAWRAGAYTVLFACPIWLGHGTPNKASTQKTCLWHSKYARALALMCCLQAKARAPLRPARPNTAADPEDDTDASGKGAGASAVGAVEAAVAGQLPQQQRERRRSGPRAGVGAPAGADREPRGRERGGGPGGAARVPMSEVEQMVAAEGNGRGGPASTLMARIWRTSRCGVCVQPFLLRASA